MPVISFEESDFPSRRVVVAPGWYRVRISRISQRPASGSNPGTKTVWPIEGTILKNAETGSTEFAGRPTPSNWMLNDNPKAKRILADFFAALGADVRPGSRFELLAAEGKELDVYIANETWEGRIVAKVTPQYRKPKPDHSPQAA